jgi:hypothetical protein
MTSVVVPETIASVPEESRGLQNGEGVPPEEALPSSPRSPMWAAEEVMLEGSMRKKHVSDSDDTSGNVPELCHEEARMRTKHG